MNIFLTKDLNDDDRCYSECVDQTPPYVNSSKIKIDLNDLYVKYSTKLKQSIGNLRLNSSIEENISKPHHWPTLRNILLTSNTDIKDLRISNDLDFSEKSNSDLEQKDMHGRFDKQLECLFNTRNNSASSFLRFNRAFSIQIFIITFCMTTIIPI